MGDANAKATTCRPTPKSAVVKQRTFYCSYCDAERSTARCTLCDHPTRLSEARP